MLLKEDASLKYKIIGTIAVLVFLIVIVGRNKYDYREYDLSELTTMEELFFAVEVAEDSLFNSDNMTKDDVLTLLEEYDFGIYEADEEDEYYATKGNKAILRSSDWLWIENEDETVFMQVDFDWETDEVWYMSYWYHDEHSVFEDGLKYTGNVGYSIYVESNGEIRVYDDYLNGASSRYSTKFDNKEDAFKYANYELEKYLDETKIEE